MDEGNELKKMMSLNDLSFAQRQELSNMLGISMAKKRPRKWDATKVPETRKSFHKEASLDSGINFEHSSTASPAISESSSESSNSSFESLWKEALSPPFEDSSSSVVESTIKETSKRERKRKFVETDDCLVGSASKRIKTNKRSGVESL